MQENNQIDFSPFAEYINTLPKSLSETPIFYSEDERVWLEGSPFFDKLNGKAEDIKRDYDLLCREIWLYRGFTLRDFSRARMIVSSRLF